MTDKHVPTLIGSSGDSLRESFGLALSELAPKFPDFVVLDADIAGGTGTHHFRKSHPDRFYQCGIAEQNMMAMAGGIAATGIPTFVTTFAVFCLRAIEQARLSIAYCQRNVKIVASHPGLEVGPDGASAQCLEDLAMFRVIPGMTVISPADPVEMRLATEALMTHSGPVYMRTGRTHSRTLFGPNHRFQIGVASIARAGSDVSLVACGSMLAAALDAAELLAKEGVDARVVNMATLKPIDLICLKSCARETGCMVTAEDHNIHGGLGGAVAEALSCHCPIPLERVGVRDCFGESGEPDELHRKYGLTAAAIASAARRSMLRKKAPHHGS